MSWPWGMPSEEPPRKKKRRRKKAGRKPATRDIDIEVLISSSAARGWRLDSDLLHDVEPWSDMWRPATDPFKDDPSRSYEREKGKK